MTDNWELRWGLGVSVRYCSKLSRHYERLEDWQAFLGAISGSAVVVSVLSSQPGLAQLFGGAAAILPLASLVFRWRDKAAFFRSRCEAYQRLLFELESGRSEARDIAAERVQLEAAEPEPSAMMWRIAANEEARVRGTTGKPLTITQRLGAALRYGMIVS